MFRCLSVNLNSSQVGKTPVAASATPQPVVVDAAMASLSKSYVASLFYYYGYLQDFQKM